MSPKKQPAEEKKSFLESPEALKLSLGELLARRREELEYSLEDIEKATRIRKKYITFIEENDWDHLADDVYSRGYVKNYADHLGLETAPVMGMYRQERLVHNKARANEDSQKAQQILRMKPLRNSRIVFTSKTLLILLATTLFLLIFSYVGWQIFVLASPPQLQLNQTSENVTTNFVIISGQVDGGADIYINDSAVLTTADGSFSERVALINGPNQIIVTAKNKLGKSRSITKSVTAQISSSSQVPEEKVSLTPIEGIQVLVTIREKATFVTIQSDGREAFRGIMLPSAKQAFSAKDKITISTSNAGQTEVMLTNMTIAEKNLGNLGNEGEPRNNFEIAKDTQFP